MKSWFGKNCFSHVYIHELARNTTSIKTPQITSLSNESYGEIIHGRIPCQACPEPVARTRRDQRAVCFTSRAARRPCPPLDDARSASQTARSSRACMVQGRRSGGLPSAARRRALRSGFVPLNTSLRLRSTVPACRPQTEAESGSIAH